MVGFPVVPAPETVTPISPLDVLDLILLHRKDNAFILDTWTV